MNVNANTPRVLITGDYIFDEILVPNNSKINRSVLTINNDDIEQYFRNSGVNVIYEFIEKMNEKNNNKITLEHLPFYANDNSHKIPKFITIEKWKTKKANDGTAKYYRDEFLGSKHESYNTKCPTCTIGCEQCIGCNKYDRCKLYPGTSPISTDHSVFSIYDRFSSMLVKGEQLKTQYEDVKRNELTKYFEKSENIILRTKYFKNKGYADIKNEKYKDLFAESPFNIITNKDDLCNKTILLVSLREIRDLETYVPVGTSWEEFIKNIDNIFTKGEYADLAKIKCVIITLEDDGVIISYENASQRKYKLICSPDTIDGYCKNHAVEYTKVSGYLSIIQGYLTYKIASDGGKFEFDKLAEICREAYVGVRYLDKLGFRREKSDERKLVIPYYKIIEHIKEYIKEKNKSETEKFSSVNIYDIDSDLKNVHFLDNSITKYSKSINGTMVNELKTLENKYIHSTIVDTDRDTAVAIAWAKYIVRHGHTKFYQKLNDLKLFVPYAKFSKVISFDKIEIEQLRDIERSIIDYNKSTDLGSPLCIAVFGEPGSGKSYTIEEMAKDIFPAEKCTITTFNISQMKSADELIDSFRLIQNDVLKDKLPIVFWDEFDSMYEQEELGWLKYFLSPMQSGKFLYNQVEYKIGRCIFIFAGGTCATHKAFIDKCKETGMKKVKAPDFLGRLKATLDIPSLSRPRDRIINDIEEKLQRDSVEVYESIIKKNLENHIKGFVARNEKTSEIIEKYAQFEALHNKTNDKDIYEDLFDKEDYKYIKNEIIKNTPKILETLVNNKYSKFSYIFKRAMVLRQNLLKILNKKDTDELKIEDPILNAFLMVDKYYYDARSMIAIMSSFHITYKEFTVRTSGIPSSQQLSLHTNEKDFVKYCQCKYDELKFDKPYDAGETINSAAEYNAKKIIKLSDLVYKNIDQNNR